jgi:molybdate transport system substrate-binding protein
VSAAPVASAVPSSASPVTSPVSQASGEVTVFAAASLTDVFNDMAQAFQAANPQAKVTYNFGSSSALATQLDQGARADVFASADQVQMDNARKGNHISGSDAVFATNRLVIITPKNNPAGVRSVADLAKPGLTLITAQPSVPIGVYTQDMLDKASLDPQLGTTFKDRVNANVVSQQTDDRQIVAQIQLGSADAAVVYKTDITPLTADALNAVDVPDNLNTRVSYPIATVTGGENPNGGAAFNAFVLSPAGQAVLAKWSFVPVRQTT